MATYQLVYVPPSPKGYTPKQLAQKIGAAGVALWAPIRRDSAKPMVVTAASALGLVPADILCRAQGQSPEALPDGLLRYTIPEMPNRSSGEGSGIFDRAAVVEALGGVGGGARMELEARYVPAAWVAFVQTPPGSKAHLAKAGTGASQRPPPSAGSHPSLEDCVLLRVAPPADGDAPTPALTSTTHAAPAPSIAGPSPSVASPTAKVPSAKRGPPPPTHPPTPTPTEGSESGKRPREHAPELETLQLTPRVARLRAELAASAAPPLQASGLFPAAAGSGRRPRVAVGGSLWQHVPQHGCIVTNFNYDASAAVTALPTRELAVVAVDSAMGSQQAEVAALLAKRVVALREADLRPVLVALMPELHHAAAGMVRVRLAALLDGLRPVAASGVPVALVVSVASLITPPLASGLAPLQGPRRQLSAAAECAAHLWACVVESVNGGAYPIAGGRSLLVGGGPSPAPDREGSAPPPSPCAVAACALAQFRDRQLAHYCTAADGRGVAFVPFADLQHSQWAPPPPVR